MKLSLPDPVRFTLALCAPWEAPPTTGVQSRRQTSS